MKTSLTMTNEEEEKMQLRSVKGKHTTRPSLDFVLGLSPSHLKDYMMNLKG